MAEVPPELHLAALRADSETVRTLLEAGADANAPADVSRRTPLHYTFCRRFGESRSVTDSDVLAVVELLLAHGADVNARAAGNWTPLSIAVQTGGPKSVKALLDNGADLEAWEYHSPLHLAAWRTDSQAVDVVKALLDSGADVNARAGYDGDTPLHRALQASSVVEVLLTAGADPHALDRHGLTPWEFLHDRASPWNRLRWLAARIRRMVATSFRASG